MVRKFILELLYTIFSCLKKGNKKMTNTEKLVLMKNRLVVLEGNGKNIKSPGVVRKLQRQIRNIENR